jgi:ATP-binding cassette, subfamily G (WHITE), member 2, PDR
MSRKSSDEATPSAVEPREPYEEYGEKRKSEELESGESSTAFPSGDSSDSEAHFGSIVTADDRAELRRIATSLSRTRSEAGDAVNLTRTETITGMPDDHPAFDPSDPGFDLYKWIKKFVRELNAEGMSLTRSGFVFKNLNVSGSGAALNLQQDITGLLTAPARLGELFSMGKKPHKQILQNFDGVLKSGELLIVLGRPGSGCSTFLKSMCGELHGLDVDSQSVMHYNGVSQEQMMKEFKGEVVYNQEVSML